jgi:hypothetical protein
MKELVDARTPWHRSLWGVGTTLQLQEILEYAEGVRLGAMNSTGLQYVLKVAATAIRRDVGIGSSGAIDAICLILDAGADKTKGVIEPHVARALDQYIQRATKGYLRRWRQWVEAGELKADNVELVARSLASHLLDAGFSGDHLHQWLLAKTGAKTTLAALIQDAERMIVRDPVEYEVLVPFDKCPEEISHAAGDRHLTADELDVQLDLMNVNRPRQAAGALKFQVTAREPLAAVGLVEIEVRRLAARAVVGLSSDRVQPSSRAIVTNVNKPKWISLKSRQRDILVSSIVRNGLLLPAQRSPATSALDDAFELLAAVETSTSWASVAAIWAAVEGLLCGPNEKGVEAADRMAAIVTAGFVRAELTQLVRHIDDEDDKKVPIDVTALGDLLGRIANGDDIGVKEPSDAAAVARVASIAADPAVVLERVRGYFADSFRRLFQQRNNLLHGGRFDSASLPATMRTVPPLVAAGVDRLVHASMTSPVTDPLNLAARAENELGLVGRAGGRDPHRLLD